MKSVYAGGEKVAEFENYNELYLGDNKPAFIYEGDELVYPNPVKDGLVLWYDFSGRTNDDGQRGIAEDLSGNGNHGTLQNFNYTAESGYNENKLLFDGVDDYISLGNLPAYNDATLSFTLKVKSDATSSHYDIIAWNTDVVLRVFYTNGRVMFIDKRKSPDRFNTHTDMTSGKTFSVTVRTSKDISEIYINGELNVSFTPDEKELMEVSLNAQIGRINSSLHYLGDIYSFSYYNRPLTPEEIAHNYAIEKERFGIE